MSPSKLSESDKKTILDLYRQPEETTSDIANRYGVSTTTISRILRQLLPADEYELLMQQKRGLGSKVQEKTQSVDAQMALDMDVEPEEPTSVSSLSANLGSNVIDAASASITSSPQRRVRKRSTATEFPENKLSADFQIESGIESVLSSQITPNTYVDEASVIHEILHEKLLNPAEFDDLEDDEEHLDDELLDDDLDDDLDDADDLDDDLAADDDGLGNIGELHLQSKAKIQILPLSEASIPRTFYLVVDRSSELITRPLKDFADLGQIPEQDILERTLPIFDDHRIARRFLRRSQRVVKVPDGKMLPKVGSYLQAKGITRLLIDGQIYSL